MNTKKSTSRAIPTNRVNIRTPFCNRLYITLARYLNTQRRSSFTEYINEWTQSANPFLTHVPFYTQLSSL